jgi:hypothetical protein
MIGIPAGAVILVSAYGIGSLILRLIRMEKDVLMCVAIGLGLSAITVWTSGLCGLLFPPVAWLFLAGGLAYTVVGGGISRPWDTIRSGMNRLLAGGNTALFLAVSFAFLSVFSFALCMVPPTLYDTMAYQLVVPQQFVLLHKVTWMPWFMPSAWPFVAQANYLWAFLLGGDWQGAAVLNWSHAVLGGWAVARLAGSLGSGMQGQTGSAVAWMLVPMVLAECSTPLSDLQPALYSVLAACAFSVWRIEGGNRMLMLAGLCGGLAGACKYTSFAILPFIALGIVASPGGLLRRTRKIFLLGLLALLPVIPLLVRNALETGSPLFPFLTGAEQSVKYSAFARGYMGERSLFNLVTVPWRVIWSISGIFQNDIWEAGGILAVMYLAPLVLLWPFAGRRQQSVAIWLSITTLGIWSLGFMSMWAMRWMLPVMAFCAVLWIRLAERHAWGIPAVLTFLAFSIVPDAFRPNNMLINAIESLNIYSGRGKSEALYLRAAPRTYQIMGAMEYIRDSVPKDNCVACWQEPRVFYARHRIAPSLMHDRSLLEDTLERSFNPEDIARRLRQSNVSHIFYCADVPPEMGAQFLMFVSEREKALWADFISKRAKLKYINPNGRYRVYEVGGSM